jgi:hypothetical protein
VRPYEELLLGAARVLATFAFLPGAPQKFPSFFLHSARKETLAGSTIIINVATFAQQTFATTGSV